MLRAKYFLPISLILLLLVVSAAPAKDSAGPVTKGTTVGEFALKVLKLASDDPSANSSMTAEEALAVLKQAGLRIKGSVNDPLTEGDKSNFALSVAGGLMERLNPPPTGFEVCMGLPSVPECHSCCLALPGATNKGCGRSCGQDHADQNHASASEPTP